MLSQTMRINPEQAAFVGLVFLRAIRFSNAHWGGGDLNFFGGYLPQFNFVEPPYLRILNSILHLETPCATLSSHILIYLIPPTPELQITFRYPPGNF